MSTLARRPALTSVDARAVMAPGVIGCAPTAPVPDVAALMVTHQLHAVIVTGPEPRLVTAHDVVRTVVSGHEATAEAIARHAPTAALDETLQAIAEAMVRDAAAHVVVVDGAGAPAGIASTFDVAAVIAGHEPRIARIIRPAPARPSISDARLERHTVAEIMHPGVVSCRADAPLAEVAGALVAHRAHTVMVAADGRRSFVTDMDVVAAAVLGDGSATARQLARSEPTQVAASDTLEVAAHRVAESSLGHVVVTDAEGVLVGVVSTLDLAGVIAAR